MIVVCGMKLRRNFWDLRQFKGRTHVDRSKVVDPYVFLEIACCSACNCVITEDMDYLEVDDEIKCITCK